ncbi:hypothetical protein EN753_01570 [Mesorhizobium sp. M2A.F.Ca.ET.029.05.1.1]|uniref:hypothetical protein n=1 Tax=Mesorhizobium sp. M2A.F.Ca.ET.029.05.1.1 TaxID=2496658 RepID=UPI000FD1C398|nr:hypothetical protein [Mesorhizobium sp. M2A.F.Ca.ET.029.05.1.1]RVD11633.1 hypothetical protein EN753_01570 [Mesorhizobium sp. M2A.F.Ca.ET.029.05.1.1]
MTVPSETNRSGPYNGNGVTTVFDYEFKITNENYIKVIKADASGVETVLTIDADYIVSDIGNPAGGQVALTVPLPTGQTLTMIPSVPFTQEIDLENQGAYYAETVERGLDLAVLRDQQLQEQISRAVTIPASEDPAQLDGLVGDILRLADSADEIDTVAANIAAVNNASANMAAIIAAPAQAAAAAASAAAASASATAAGNSATAAASSAADAATAAASLALPNPPVANSFLQRNAGNTAYDAKTVKEVRDALDAAPYVTTRAALKALDTTKDQLAYQVGVGWFEWTLGDFSARQAADTAEAIYVAADGIANTVGCWVLARGGYFPALIGQGAGTYVNFLSYPAAIGGRHYAIGGQISAGNAAAGDKVGVYGAAETGPSGNSDVWGSNFLAQWNTGDPDVNVQTIEVDFNNRSVDAAHQPAKLKVGINVTSGGTKIAGYGYYLDATNKAVNGWRQGVVINDGAVLDTGFNVGMLAYSATYAGRQIVDGGDTLLLQRRTDAATPAGYFARFLNFANTLALWSVDILGNTSVGPKAAAAAGPKLHVSQEDNASTAEFQALGLEGNSTANSIAKVISANLYGRDTANTRKLTGAIKSIPSDSNWVDAALGISTRVADALVEVLRVSGKGFGYVAGVGGTVVQATSKATGVTLSKVTGKITTAADALAANTAVTFTLTNTNIAATDTLILNHAGGGTFGAYALNARCAAGSATIAIRNLTAGSLSEALDIRFAIIKSVDA